MREIADEAGLSPGNLHYYFDSKDELLVFCQERTLEHMLAAVDAARLAALALPVGSIRTTVQSLNHGSNSIQRPGSYGGFGTRIPPLPQGGNT
jgi:AcrR family transcriptional regulator